MSKIKDYLIERQQKENERLDHEYQRIQRKKRNIIAGIDFTQSLEILNSL